MTRIGNRLRQACAAAAASTEPVTTAHIARHMPDVERANIDKYCSRAVGLRLMTVDRTARPKQYSVVPGWREKLDEFRPYRPRVAASPIQQKPHINANLFTVWR